MVIAEHEKKDTIVEDVYYPDHRPRTESSTFRHAKTIGHNQKLPCAISGHTDGTEYHHLFCEWAFSDAVDWSLVKKIATGEIKELPVLDLHTDQPTGTAYPAQQSLIWSICKLAEARGFNWHEFDPAHPETFVDSPQNIIVLNSKFHRGPDHGIHALTLPIWLFQAFPRKDGFVFSPDEE